jgi:hypothetical protein
MRFKKTANKIFVGVKIKSAFINGREKYIKMNLIVL